MSFLLDNYLRHVIPGLYSVGILKHNYKVVVIRKQWFNAYNDIQPNHGGPVKADDDEIST